MKIIETIKERIALRRLDKALKEYQARVKDYEPLTDEELNKLMN